MRGGENTLKWAEQTGGCFGVVGKPFRHISLRANIKTAFIKFGWMTIIKESVGMG